MADAKKYLDLEGLKKYDAKIKGYADQAEADALSAAKSYTDGKIGTLDTGVATVAAAITAEKNRAEGVEGVLTSLNTDAKNTLVAAINEVDAHADAANTAIGADDTAGTVKYRIKQLETAVGDGGSVAEKIKTEIEKLDATVGSTTVATDKHVAVQVVEADGVLTGVTVTESDIASADALSKLQTVVGISELATGAKSVKERLEVIEGADTVEGSVAKALKDAKAYTDEKDTAMDGRVDKLEALHATKTVGEATVFQTVAEEVATGIANLRDGADAAFDTLKEIANWINNSDENAEGFNAAKKITDNADAITKLNGADTVDGSVAKKIKTAIEGLDAEASQTAGTDGLALSITEVDGKITAISGSIAANTYDAYGAAAAVQGDTTATVKAVKDIADANKAALETLNGANTVAGSVAKSIKDAVEALDATVSVDGTAADANGLTLQVVETDGKLTGVSGSINTVTEADINAMFA